jgi:hypothetical protein
MRLRMSPAVGVGRLRGSWVVVLMQRRRATASVLHGRRRRGRVQPPEFERCVALRVEKMAVGRRRRKGGGVWMMLTTRGRAVFAGIFLRSCSRRVCNARELVVDTRRHDPLLCGIQSRTPLSPRPLTHAHTHTCNVAQTWIWTHYLSLTHTHTHTHTNTINH